MAEEEQAINAESTEKGREAPREPKKQRRPPTQDRRCQRDAGTDKQCRAARLMGREFCFFHDPGIRGHRLELRELNELPMGRSRDLHRLLTRVVRAVEKNKLNPQQAYAIGWLVQLLLRTLEGVEKERNYHHSRSYGELYTDAYWRLKTGQGAKIDKEYGPDEADEGEWFILEE
ncbi:MAG TPA: hypothetical protein VNN18_11260 [Candidatus Xenobia bacterium]|nr:hypothetical protein [Candidatus Xenobia bacterium]